MYKHEINVMAPKELKRAFGPNHSIMYGPIKLVTIFHKNIDRLQNPMVDSTQVSPACMNRIAPIELWKKTMTQVRQIITPELIPITPNKTTPNSERLISNYPTSMVVFYPNMRLGIELKKEHKKLTEVRIMRPTSTGILNSPLSFILSNI